jgi:Domain of unknown function (DUF4271)
MLLSNLSALRETPNLFENWMTPIFVIIFVLFAYINVNYGKKFQQIFNSVFRLGYLKQMMREEQTTLQRSAVALNIVFVLMLGLFLYEYFSFNDILIFKQKGLTLYFICVVGLAVIYTVKYITIKFFATLFKFNGPLEEYLYNLMQINKTIGILLFPILILCTFSNKEFAPIFFVSIGIGLLVFIFYRLLRGLVIGFSYNVSKLYIILYLCTVELIPFILIAKAVLI